MISLKYLTIGILSFFRITLFSSRKLRNHGTNVLFRAFLCIVGGSSHLKLCSIFNSIKGDKK